MTDFVLEFLSVFGLGTPQAAMKALEAPIMIPFIPYTYCPWIVLGALLLLLFYIFQR
jgi:hypothetical protein